MYSLSAVVGKVTELWVVDGPSGGNQIAPCLPTSGSNLSMGSAGASSTDGEGPFSSSEIKRQGVTGIARTRASEEGRPSRRCCEARKHSRFRAKHVVMIKRDIVQHRRIKVYLVEQPDCGDPAADLMGFSGLVFGGLLRQP